MKRKVELRKGKVLTMDGLFKLKERYHTELSKLPFEKKIEILIKMRKIAGLKG